MRRTVWLVLLDVAEILIVQTLGRRRPPPDAILAPPHSVRAVAEPSDADKLRIDFYKDHYKEFMNNYRYFGSLRAAIAWTPATITIALATFLIKEMQAPVVPVMLALGAVLVMIFATNIHLHREQIVFQNMCKICEDEWKKLGAAAAPMSYGEMRDKAVAGIGPAKYFELSTIMLLLFFLVLGALPLITVL